MRSTIALAAITLCCVGYVLLSGLSHYTDLVALGLMSVGKNNLMSNVSQTYLNQFRPQQICRKQKLTLQVTPGMRLGNLMWLYAAAYGIARYNRVSLQLPVNFGMTKAFTLDVPETLNDEAMAQTDWVIVNDLIVEKTSCCYWMEFHDGIFNLTQYGCSNFKLNGYFQAWQYFAKYESDIRRQFTFSTVYQQRAQDNVRAAFNSLQLLLDPNATSSTPVSDVVFVGVHVRLGDWAYDNLQHMADYLAKAVRYFVQIYSNCVFIVCSEDQNWSRNNMRLEPHMTRNHTIWFSPQADRDVDMATLVSCNHSIITVGTFGWWVAYLTRGTTVYYEVGRQKLIKVPLTSNVSHYFYPGWVVL